MSLEELKGYCRDSGNYWEYDGGCRPEISADVESEELPEEFNEMARVYQVERSYVCELPSGKLLGEHAVVAMATDELVLESARGNHTKLHSAIAEPSFPRRMALVGPSESAKRNHREHDCVFPLVLPKATFFVWVIEYLPKLQAWDHYTRETGRQPAVVLWPDAPSWMRMSNELLSVDEVIQERFDVLHADKVVLGTHRYHNVGIDYNPYCPSEYRWLGDRMRNAVDSYGSPERVYISRADASR